MAVADFETYRITNGHVKFEGDVAAQELGCTGALEVETETREVVKKCEGRIVDKKIIIESMSMTLTGHIKVDTLRKIYGIDTTGLKAGVYSYGNKSIPKRGCWTFDALDLYEENKKLMAFPKTVNTTGLKLSIENGGDEVAEVELEMSVMPDSEGEYYYEAFEADVTDAAVKTGWHTNFTPELVKAAAI